MASAFVPQFLLPVPLFVLGMFLTWVALSMLAVGFYRLLTGERVL